MVEKHNIAWADDLYYEDITYLECLHKLVSDGKNYREIATLLGVTEKQAWNAIDRHINRPNAPVVVSNSVAPDFTDKVRSVLTGWDLIDHAITEQEYKEKRQYWQDSATVPIKADEPVIVVFSSDWHFGSLATDHNHVSQWLKYFLETPDIYMICVGVDLENRSVFRSHQPTVDQVMSPEDQREFLRWLWKQMVDSNKIIASCWDNHLIEQYENLLGYSDDARMMGEDVVYFRGRGLLTLEIGDQKYTHFLTHKARFNSSANAAHGIKQQARLEGNNADVKAAGHIHNPTVEEYWEGGEPKVALITGTFKTDDPYSVRHFAQGTFAAPTVVYHPDMHKFLAFRSVDDAIIYREGWRKRRGK